MNPLNPRNIKDHERYDNVISTEYGHDKFWKLRNSLGHYFWEKAQDAIEENLRNNGNRTNMIAMIARARKAKLQREWKETLERRRELQNWARAMATQDVDTAVKKGSAAERRQKYLALKEAFNPIVNVDDFLKHPLRRRGQEMKDDCKLFAFPRPLPRHLTLIQSVL